MRGAATVSERGFIIEEGLAFEVLTRVVESMRRAAVEAGVTLVTGDTKVVDRGKADGLYINTAGVGLIEHDRGRALERQVWRRHHPVGRHRASRDGRDGRTRGSRIRVGHRERLCAAPRPRARPAGLGVPTHCLRDLTRGGLASALVEIAEASRLHLAIEEAAVAVREDVRGACEILGFDPMYVANEGRFIAFVPELAAPAALGVLERHPVSEGAAVIGRVGETPAACSRCVAGSVPRASTASRASSCSRHLLTSGRLRHCSFPS